MRKPMVFLAAAALAVSGCGMGHSYERENLPQGIVVQAEETDETEETKETEETSLPPLETEEIAKEAAAMETAAVDDREVPAGLPADSETEKLSVGTPEEIFGDGLQNPDQRPQNSRETGTPFRAVVAPGRSLIETDESTGQAVFFVSCPSIEIDGRGRQVLQKAVDRYWSGVWSGLETYYYDNLEKIREDYGNFPGSGHIVQHDCEVMRSDDQILSFTDNRYSCETGPIQETESSLKGVNLNPDTGQQLTLRDVASDYNGLYEYVRTFLARMDMLEGGRMMYGFYTARLYELFQSDLIQWTMDERGITIYLGREVFEPLLNRSIEVPVLFEEQPQLFRDRFIP